MDEDLLKVAEQGGGKVTCPKCSGGRSKELSAAVYYAGSRWWVKCHRASCGYCRPLDGSSTIPHRERVAVTSYEGPVKRLPAEHLDYLLAKHPLLKDDKWLRYNPENNTLLFPFYRHNKRAGFVERAAKAGEESPFSFYRHVGPWWLDKSKTFYQDVEFKGCLGWYGTPVDGRAIIVEDCMSAIIGHEVTGECFVALLGTGLNAAKVTELYSGGVDHLRIALDKDATGQAFALARKWGLGFSSCRVTPLDKDLKDMVQSEINDLRFR